jgi:hypothetical protein
MELKFVEAGHCHTAGTVGNWGKFAVGRFGGGEWVEPSRFPRCETPSLIRGQGWSGEHVLVLDLATGEGAMFRPPGLASADLQKHAIWVCPLFQPFLEWLYEQVRASPGWWDTLARTVELPDAPFAFAGHRQPGPGGPTDAELASRWFDEKLLPMLHDDGVADDEIGALRSRHVTDACLNSEAVRQLRVRYAEA